MIMNMNHTELALALTAHLAEVEESLSAYASVTDAKDGSVMDYLELSMHYDNVSGTGNGSLAIDPVLIESFTQNRRIVGFWYYALIVFYGVLIVFGSLGNMLVVVAIMRKPMMRTTRNLFIFNLAISDLLLCVVTMPLTLMEILSKFWPFGSNEMLCKSIPLLQAVSIFVSSITITAIAIDRYKVIVYPTRESVQHYGAIGVLIAIWLFAIVAASPMSFYKRLQHPPIPPMLEQLGIRNVAFCIEDWPVSYGRFIYSTFSLCIQYLAPISCTSGAYCRIYNKLKSRVTVVAVQTSQRKAERGRRLKRTNCLLMSIAVIFGISWMPLNIFNMYADIHGSAASQKMTVIYAMCHMAGMSSACSNPLLYGWLNDNFRKEFKEILCRIQESTNVALNGHTTGSGQTRRRRKHADIAKGDLKLLGAGGGLNGGGGASGGISNAGGNDNTNGLRSVVTESFALTENPMSTEVTILMPR